MTRLDVIVTHDATDDCVACRAQSVVMQALVPAAAAWEATAELPRHAVALHGAAALLGTMLEEGVSRDEVEAALSGLLDNIEQQIAEDQAMGGPPQGTA
jgi:hypothetical protein